MGRGCRRRRRDVRLLREAALALGFPDVSHGAVEIGVRTVSRISDDAGDDERGDFLVARNTFVFECRFGFDRVLHCRFEIGVAGRPKARFCKESR